MKLSYDELLSSCAFGSNLRRYDEDWDNLQAEKKFSDHNSYCHSKTCVKLFSFELHQRLQRSAAAWDADVSPAPVNNNGAGAAGAGGMVFKAGATNVAGGALGGAGGVSKIGEALRGVVRQRKQCPATPRHSPHFALLTPASYVEAHHVTWRS